jgi:hypothetical protein
MGLGVWGTELLQAWGLAPAARREPKPVGLSVVINPGCLTRAYYSATACHQLNRVLTATAK